ncbi:MAG: HAD hydrolase family protein [Muribaculaceae bacterium]|nr:HAD hydrolase family protein [Muribaculaceae bacterium]
MINYDLTLIKGIVFDVDGVLSPSTIPLHPSGEPMRMVNIKDGYALQLAVKHGLRLAILTGAATHAIEVRFGGLGITDIYMGASMKLPVLEQWMAKHNLRPEQVAYVGDDIPDLQVMRHVGLPVAPADAAPECAAVARHITPCKGGYGVARHLIEAVLKAQGLWLDEQHAFGW